MSFSDFLRWIREFFSSRSAPNSSSGSSTDTTPVETAKPESPSSEPSSSTSSSSAGTASTGNSSSTPSSSSATPAVSETVSAAPPVTTPAEPQSPVAGTSPTTTEVPATTNPAEPIAATPPPLPVTPAPAISTPTETQQTPPVISRITTEDPKVALNQEISFQLVTSPANQYENCRIDLSRAHDASIVKPIDPVTGKFSLTFNKASKTDNDTQLIRVNNPQGEASTAVTVSLMKLFWHNHSGRKNICDETLFVNQCAIRMGSALELSGIKMSQDRRVLRRCTTEYRAFKHHKDGLVKGHVLAAQELANWIKSQRSTFGNRSIVHSKEEILGRSGVIFFRDGWGTTDHIDVWDGQALVGGFPSYFDSDFKELWFWDVY